MISRRAFVKGAAAGAAMLRAGSAFANPLGLPIGLQLYSVRDSLPKDYEGTLRQLASIGYQEVEAAGFYGRSATDVKQAMSQAGLHCVSAHYSLPDLKPKVDEVIQYGQQLGLEYIICSSPMLQNPQQAKGKSWVQGVESMTLDDWKWNADQFNQIGKKVHAAGMKFGYHNHFFEFHEHDGIIPYNELLRLTDPQYVTMEMDCGWVVVGGKRPEDYLTRFPNRFSMLHIKQFNLKGWKPGTEPVSAEMGHGTIDYKSIFAAAKHAHIRHMFIEQEQYPDMPEMQALKVDADWMKAFPS